MNRLDKLIVILFFLLAGLEVVGWQPPLQDDPTAGRRPLSPTAEEPPQPRPSIWRLRRPLPPPSLSDPLFLISGAEPRTATIGTAFAIDSQGTWMTARHVIQGCKQVGLVPRGWDESRAYVAYAHPTADVAIIAVNRVGPPVSFGEETLTLGQIGFSVGFPGGKIGAASFRLMGRGRMQGSGWMHGISPVVTWAERSRFPEGLETLGGMSGGPVVDESGKVVGVLVAGSPRRGRMHSIAPELLREVRRAHGPLAGGASKPLDRTREGRGRLTEFAEVASLDYRIGLVSCRR